MEGRFEVVAESFVHMCIADLELKKDAAYTGKDVLQAYFRGMQYMLMQLNTSATLLCKESRDGVYKAVGNMNEILKETIKKVKQDDFFKPVTKTIPENSRQIVIHSIVRSALEKLENIALSLHTAEKLVTSRLQAPVERRSVTVDIRSPYSIEAICNLAGIVVNENTLIDKLNSLSITRCEYHDGMYLIRTPDRWVMLRVARRSFGDSPAGLQNPGKAVSSEVGGCSDVGNHEEINGEAVKHVNGEIQSEPKKYSSHLGCDCPEADANRADNYSSE